MLMAVLGDGQTAWQCGQQLTLRGNYYEILRLDSLANQSQDALQHLFWTEGQSSLISSHSARFAAAEDDGPSSHSRQLVDAPASEGIKGSRPVAKAIRIEVAPVSYARPGLCSG